MPGYLHNRPGAVIKHCLDQIEASKALSAADIDHNDGIYHVRSVSRPTETYEVNLHKPHCTCYTWLRNGLPCKHMFGLFKLTAETWESLPDNYKNSPFLTLDPDICSETPEGNISEGPADIVDEDPEPMAIGEISDNDANEDDNQSTQSVDIPSCEKMQKKCREVLRQIREYTFLVDNPTTFVYIVRKSGRMSRCIEKGCTTGEWFATITYYFSTTT